MRFDDKTKYQQFISTRLRGSGVPAEVLTEFATEFDVQTELIFPSLPPGTFAMIVPRTRWIIRDDDLKVLDALVDALKSLAPMALFVNSVAGPQMVTAATGVLVALARLVRQSTKKGTRVDDSELRVLVMLKTNPSGLTVSEIAAILSRYQAADVAHVERILVRLAKHAVADGSTVSFVAEDGEGRWRAAGV